MNEDDVTCEYCLLIIYDSNSKDMKIKRKKLYFDLFFTRQMTIKLRKKIKHDVVYLKFNKKMANVLID